MSMAPYAGRIVSLDAHRDVVGLPFPNEHSARLRDPDDFDPDSFRRTKGGSLYGSKQVPETIGIVWAKLKGKAEPDDPVLPQALRFPTEHWTADEAKAWLKDNEIEYSQFEPATDEEKESQRGGAKRVTLRAAAPLRAGEFRVDREAGALRGVSVITRGPAIGHGFLVDDVMLGQVEAAINRRERGVRCRLTHSGTTNPWGADGILELVGRIRDARIDGGQVRADLQFGRYADDSPRGRLKTYLLGVAEEDPEAVGLSIVFERLEFEEQPADPKTGASFPPLGRVKDVIFVDFTDDPAANPGGLLSTHHGGGGAPADTSQEDDLMNAKLRTYLEKCGLKKEATLEEALAFLAKLSIEQKTEAERLAAEPAPAAAAASPPPPPAPDAAAVLAKKAAEEAEALARKAATDAVIAERKRAADLQALAKKEGLSAEWAERMVQGDRSLAEAEVLAKEIKAAVAERQPLAISVGADLGRESLPPAMADAVLLRAGLRLKQRDPATGAVSDRKPHDRAIQFRGMRLPALARFHLAVLGEPIDGLSDAQIASLVFAPKIRHQALSQGTSDFPAILEDAANKTLLVAYEEAAPMWPAISRRATAPDFKAIRRIRRGEFSNLPVVVEDAEYSFVRISEKKETYVLVKRGFRFGLTWETIVNDDLAAFSGVLVDMGQAARRTEDAVTIAVVIANPAMADGKRLFSTEHKNLASGAELGAPSVATFNVAFSAMGVQTGLSADAYLNLQPAVIAAPHALGGTVKTLLASEYDPANDKARARNIYQGRLREAYHAALDNVPTTGKKAWYLFADPAVIAALETCFLEGYESPTLEEAETTARDGREYKVRHVVAAAAVEHRAAYSNPGG